MKNKAFFAAVTAIVLGMTMSACSLRQERPVLGPNDSVVSDDGETLVISTKEVAQNPVFTPEWNNTINVWKVSQETLKYYKYGGTVYVSGQLKVTAGVNNLAYDKVVGIRYTLDNWKTYKDYNGYWISHDGYGNTDNFEVLSESTIKPGTLVKYAIYFKANGKTYWNNNYGANFSAQF
ncbi:MAG: hypothetical protein A2Y33_12060 [Spirochaetes bacterium GWF1_51_8]|nr:MAG: hypothetical protein A2Y33_12060 [Spirochaetes bacterium GWF1_51_8]